MTIRLPDPIAAYYEVSNTDAYALLHRCFATEAVVHDEGHTHQGRTAIKAWLQDTKNKYQHSVEPLNVHNKTPK